MKTSRIFATAAAVALLATSMSACGSSKTAENNTKGNQVNVVATTTQICDYVTQIASTADANSGLSLNKTDSQGKKSVIGAPANKAKSTINLTCLLAPNASAHEHEMTPAQSKALSKADLMLVSGVDLEHFLDQAVEATGFKGTMGVTSGILTADEIKDPKAQAAKEKNLPYKVDRGIAKVHAEKWPFPPEEGEKEPEFQYDPHIWTSTKNTMIQVKNIGAFLGKSLPKSKPIFDEHVEKFVKALTDLDAWATKALNSVPQEHRVLFTSHDAFGYFSRDYNVKFIGAALSDFNSQQDATADHIKQAAEDVKKSGAVAIFAENSNNSKSIKAVAAAAGVKAVIGDDALYGDSLGPVGSAGETYIGSIVHNVETLVKAWNGKVPELPDSVKTALKK
ncbi:metal ABC transporter substrate-binding protein [Gardnerella sp. Marseille-Q9691]|uniref:metal ABC transporter substrate-binding protein n=1 Tax=Gardnerella sp. Marseille-Q9691 TaxID=3390096 RepID=UPI003970542D